MDRFFPPNSWEQITNWWLTYPPEKYEFVRWDHHPNYWGKLSIHVPNHEPETHIPYCRFFLKFLMKIESILTITQFKWEHGNIDHVLIAHVCTPSLQPWVHSPGHHWPIRFHSAERSTGRHQILHFAQQRLHLPWQTQLKPGKNGPKAGLPNTWLSNIE